jgi:uncharacterized membrane protein YeaQ/YmgE (transglycosylase-associated protein family)
VVWKIWSFLVGKYATWFVRESGLPFGWMIDMWLGAILATLVAGWVYKDRGAIANRRSAIADAYFAASTNTAVP